MVNGHGNDVNCDDGDDVNGDDDGDGVNGDDVSGDDDGDLWHDMEQRSAEKNSGPKAEKEGGEHYLIEQ